MKMIEVRNLGKKYKNNDSFALSNANFIINEGDIVGLVGKNGSGKSTLLKLLSKSQRPTTGEIFFKGDNIFKENNILNDFGIMIQPVFFPQISVRENLELYLTIHKKAECLKNIEETLKLVGLWESKHRKPVDFSFGMKQRLALAIALVTKPKFVLLDEPFVGLDPNGVKNLLGILKEWAISHKTSMIVSSHQLAELQDLCNRYLFIDNGIIKHQLINNQKGLLVELKDDLNTDQTFLIERLASTFNLNYDNNKIELTENLDSFSLNEILSRLAEKKLIKTIISQKDSLESLFEEN